MQFGSWGGTMTLRIHLLLMTILAAVSSFLVAWIPQVSLTGWSIVVYFVSYGGVNVPKKVPSPLGHHMDLYPWCTQFLWQHSLSVGVLSFLVCLGLVWLHAWWRPKDVTGQWAVLLTVCLLLQVFVSFSMVLPLSDPWAVERTMTTYLQLRPQ